MNNDARSLALAPIDYVFCGDVRHPITFVFHFEQRQSFARLRASLAETLESFYPLKGRLVQRGADAYVIEEDVSSPIGAVDFDETEVGQLPDPRETQAMLAFAEPVNHAIGQPLAKFRLIHGPRGDLLSASVSHGATDGFGYLFFLLSWAGRCRGVALPPPAHNRAALMPSSEVFGELSADAVFSRTGFSLLPDEQWDTETQEYDELVLDAASVAAERSAAEQAVGHKLSRNDVLTARILKHAAEAWHKPGDRLRLNCAFDFRKLVPEISPLYFGNGVRGACLEASYEVIMRSSLGQLAERIQAVNAGIARPEVDDALACLEGIRVQGGVHATRGLHVWHPQQGVLVTNLTRLPLSELNFGAGAASAFYPVGAARAAVILPNGDGERLLIGRPSKAARRHSLQSRDIT